MAASLNRLIRSSLTGTIKDGRCVQGIIAVTSTHVLQNQIRPKSKIHYCGYLEHAEFKKRDIRYKTDTRHDPKRMNWHDYQFRKFKAVHWHKPYPLWQANMDYAENLCRLGMSDWAIQNITQLHPHCIQYIKRKLSGNVKLLREAEYSNYVNHKIGDR